VPPPDISRVTSTFRDSEFLLSNSQRDNLALAIIFVHHLSHELQLLMLKMDIKALEARIQTMKWGVFEGELQTSISNWYCETCPFTKNEFLS
jgi:hypothetical protein